MSDGVIAQSAVLLAGVWAAGTVLLSASGFVNNLRETTVIGKKDGVPLCLAHRRVLRNDWLLTMIGAVAFPLVYGIVLMVLGLSFVPKDAALPQFTIIMLASLPIVGAAIFVACGIGDWKLMGRALAEADLAEKARIQAASVSKSS